MAQSTKGVKVISQSWIPDFEKEVNKYIKKGYIIASPMIYADDDYVVMMVKSPGLSL